MTTTAIPTINILDTKIQGTNKKAFPRKKGNSINGRMVAREVIETLQKGKKVNMSQIQMRHGYSKSSAYSLQATKTRSYQEEIAPVISQMESLRQKTIQALHGKDLSVAKVFDLNLLLKNLNHDLQLFNGKSTANHSHINKVVVFGSDDFLAMQMENKQLQGSS